MVNYVVRRDASPSARDEVTQDHFGVNLVTIYDEEFVHADPSLRKNIVDLGATTLRFPGGSATEFYFDMTNPNASVSAYDSSEKLTPMDAFFARAGQLGVDATIVLPTRLAFGTTAGTAMVDGSYGQRQDLSAAYLEGLEDFIRLVLQYARQTGVQVDAFEIGNEFWGSGQMTATEYGHVAADVALLLDRILAQEAYNGAQIAVQSTSAASQIFSSRNDVDVYVNLSGPQDVFMTRADAEATLTAAELASWTLVSLSGQGAATEQVSDIVQSINALPDAGDAIDAVIQHSYETGGFDTVDGGKRFKYNQFHAFEDQLNRDPAQDELEFHMTEWNTRSHGAEHNRGLHNASMMIEAFYEMTINGIDAAQIWPLSFDRAQGVALTDTDDDDLSIAGEMFSLMSNSLVGLSPILDWSMRGEIDIHGFADEDRTVLFVSERSGSAQKDVSLDLSDVLEDGFYYVTFVELWDGGAGGNTSQAEPVLSASAATLSKRDVLDFDLNAWANLRIELDQHTLNSPDTAKGRGSSAASKTSAGETVEYNLTQSSDEFWL